MNADDHNDNHDDDRPSGDKAVEGVEDSALNRYNTDIIDNISTTEVDNCSSTQHKKDKKRRRSISLSPPPKHGDGIDDSQENASSERSPPAKQRRIEKRPGARHPLRSAAPPPRRSQTSEGQLGSRMPATRIANLYFSASDGVDFVPDFAATQSVENPEPVIDKPNAVTLNSSSDQIVIPFLGDVAKSANDASVQASPAKAEEISVTLGKARTSPASSPLGLFEDCTVVPGPVESLILGPSDNLAASEMSFTPPHSPPAQTGPLPRTEAFLPTELYFGLTTHIGPQQQFQGVQSPDSNNTETECDSDLQYIAALVNTDSDLEYITNLTNPEPVEKKDTTKNKEVDQQTDDDVTAADVKWAEGIMKKLAVLRAEQEASGEPSEKTMPASDENGESYTPPGSPPINGVCYTPLGSPHVASKSFTPPGSPSALEPVPCGHAQTLEESDLRKLIVKFYEDVMKRSKGEELHDSTLRGKDGEKGFVAGSSKPLAQSAGFPQLSHSGEVNQSVTKGLREKAKGKLPQRSIAPRKPTARQKAREAAARFSAPLNVEYLLKAIKHVSDHINEQSTFLTRVFRTEQTLGVEFNRAELTILYRIVEEHKLSRGEVYDDPLFPMLPKTKLKELANWKAEDVNAYLRTEDTEPEGTKTCPHSRKVGWAKNVTLVDESGQTEYGPYLEPKGRNVKRLPVYVESKWTPELEQERKRQEARARFYTPQYAPRAEIDRLRALDEEQKRHEQQSAEERIQLVTSNHGADATLAELVHAETPLEEVPTRKEDNVVNAGASLQRVPTLTEDDLAHNGSKPWLSREPTEELEQHIGTQMDLLEVRAGLLNPTALLEPAPATARPPLDRVSASTETDSVSIHLPLSREPTEELEPLNRIQGVPLAMEIGLANPNVHAGLAPPEARPPLDRVPTFIEDEFRPRIEQQKQDTHVASFMSSDTRTTFNHAPAPTRPPFRRQPGLEEFSFKARNELEHKFDDTAENVSESSRTQSVFEVLDVHRPALSEDPSEVERSASSNSQDVPRLSTTPVQQASPSLPSEEQHSVASLSSLRENYQESATASADPLATPFKFDGESFSLPLFEMPKTTLLKSPACSEEVPAGTPSPDTCWDELLSGPLEVPAKRQIPDWLIEKIREAESKPVIEPINPKLNVFAEANRTIVYNNPERAKIEGKSDEDGVGEVPILTSTATPDQERAHGLHYRAHLIKTQVLKPYGRYLMAEPSLLSKHFDGYHDEPHPEAHKRSSIVRRNERRAEIKAKKNPTQQEILFEARLPMRLGQSDHCSFRPSASHEMRVWKGKYDGAIINRKNLERPFRERLLIELMERKAINTDTPQLVEFDLGDGRIVIIDLNEMEEEREEAAEGDQQVDPEDEDGEEEKEDEEMDWSSEEEIFASSTSPESIDESDSDEKETSFTVDDDSENDDVEMDGMDSTDDDADEEDSEAKDSGLADGAGPTVTVRVTDEEVAQLERETDEQNSDDDERSDHKGQTNVDQQEESTTPPSSPPYTLDAGLSTDTPVDNTGNNVDTSPTVHPELPVLSPAHTPELDSSSRLVYPNEELFAPSLRVPIQERWNEEWRTIALPLMTHTHPRTMERAAAVVNVSSNFHHQPGLDDDLASFRAGERIGLVEEAFLPRREEAAAVAQHYRGAHLALMRPHLEAQRRERLEEEPTRHGPQELPPPA